MRKPGPVISGMFRTMAEQIDEAHEPLPRRISFEPGLEGLRGLSVAGILAFHAEFAWAAGGFLGVSTFFTLSGFLIGSLFLAERQETGRIDLPAFWARRFRRLMPASLLALAGITVFGATVATPDQLTRLRGDVLWAIGYAANWRFLLSDAAYAELFAAPSPVQHFWSLAIEEQLYALFPLLAAWGLAATPGASSGFARVLAIASAASLCASLALFYTGASFDRIYYGTDTRAAELLVGGLLAVWLCGRDLPSHVTKALQGLGAVALVAMGAIWSRAEIASPWLYAGGLSAYSALSVLVIAAAVQPSGPVRFVLSTWPLCALGRISYGVYLYHWPMYLWLTPERTGLESAGLLALRALATLCIATLSYHLIEAPVRSRRALRGGWLWVGALATAAAIAIAAIVVTAHPPDDAIDFAGAEALVEAEIREFAAATSGLSADTSGGPRMTLFGDSSALMLNYGLAPWLSQSEIAQQRPGSIQIGCGLTREGFDRFRGKPRELARICESNHAAWKDRLDLARPEIAVVFVGTWEVVDRMLPGDDIWRRPGDPILDAYLQERMISTVELLSSHGALVVWLTHPTIEIHEKGGIDLPATPYPTSDPTRMIRFNELVFELERLRPDLVRVADLAAYMRSLPGGEMDPAYRPDGTHFTEKAARRVVEDWLGPEILRLYREHSQRPPGR